MVDDSVKSLRQADAKLGTGLAKTTHHEGRKSALGRRHEVNAQSAVRVMPVERGGFIITVPMPWWEFDVDPGTRQESTRRLIGQRVRGNNLLGEHRCTLSKLRNKAAREAYDFGAVFVGCMAQNVDAIQLTATVTVSIVGARTPAGQLPPTDPAAIVASLHDKPARHAGDPGARSPPSPALTLAPQPETPTASKTSRNSEAAERCAPR